MTLDYSWSRIERSRLAAATVTYALKKINEHYYNKWKCLANQPAYYTIDSLKPLHATIEKMLAKMNDEKFKYREPFQKYSHKKFGCVSISMKNCF